ncbi:synaptogenesis protein syg-2-like isoform X2 [Limulus polyphemus]|uniref:Synaptogenesis protein syg-2-like isoform X2 n=1 Tax=Limulus polyphemus TaxID=6850 RepID=A0ABM1SMX0_LIMPO|nr:synaptogenesis protein syg-2-like isoform X2 [Limulus polyphemus]
MARTSSYFHYVWWIFFVSVFVILLAKGGCQKQYFRVEPRASDVIQGYTIDLQCHIGNLAGAVQWSKDGFVLGYDPDIPGYPRYVMIINPNNGVYNLRVSQAQLKDEGVYQCQVGPAPGNKPIRSQANLTVLVPPEKVEIRHRSNGSVLEVREAERVSLTCYAYQSKPQSQLKWYRNRKELKDPVPYEVEDLRNKLFTTFSTITIHPKLEDNNATYTCEVVHPTLKTSLTATVRISVLYPPEPPEIEGYNEQDIVQIGDTLTLACISRGGNPPATLVWFRNGVQVDKTFSVIGQETTNKHIFRVTASDNKAVYRCEASNSVTLQPLKASLTLNVLFSPSKVTIKGHREGRIGDNITLTCLAGPSNPESELSWIVDGLPVFSTFDTTLTSLGTWFTTSNISFTLTKQDPDTKTFSCVAVNKILNEHVTQTAKLSVIYPPGPPSVEELDNEPIISGEIKQITCVSFGGNPRATIRWFKGDMEVVAMTKPVPNGVASSLIIQAEASDNGAVYRCEASNPAIPRPLVVSVTTRVIFPPAELNVEIKPQNPRENQIVTITCESGSSNPESIIQWWRNDKLISGDVVAISRGDYGGKVTRSRLRFNVSFEDDGSVFVCQATNPRIHRSIQKTIKLEILYKPRFLVQNLERFDVLEGESAHINVTVKANPSSISYQWFQEGQLIIDPSSSALWITHGPHSHNVFARGSVLEIPKVSRNHAGLYVCEAANSEGATKIEIIINVLYQATITKFSHTVLANPGDDAQFECIVNGNPLTDDTIRWARSGFDKLRTQVVSSRGHSILNVFNVSRKDAGEFHCLAYNGIGEETEARIQLVVKFKPVIHLTRQLLNVAVDQGNTARLVCVVEAAPSVNFTWSLDSGVVIGSYLGISKYTIQKAQLDETMWESVLFIKNVTDTDYGKYMCIVKNELGVDDIIITLRRKGKPDSPENFHVLNVSYDSVSLGWIPGFNGGAAQEFQIRYRESRSKIYSFTKFIPGSSVLLVVRDLKPQSEYVFEIMARNKYGESRNTNAVVTTKILDNSLMDTSKAMVNSTDEDNKGISSIFIIVGVIAGACLVFLNIIFVIYFIRKRKHNQQNQDVTSERKTSEVSDSQMYTPSNYQEKINGEALYPVQDESNETSHDIMLKEVPNNRKNVEVENEQSKSPKYNKPSEERTEEEQNREMRTCSETDKDCPDILKKPEISSIENREVTKREYNKPFMNGGRSQRKEFPTQAVDISNVPYPASTKTAKVKHVQIILPDKEPNVRARDLVVHTSSKPQKYVVGKLGVHVV